MINLHSFIIKYAGDGFVTLFNPINDALLVVPEDKIVNDTFSDTEMQCLDSYMFTNHGNCSSEFAHALYQRIKYSKRKITLIIHTNFSCNMSCSYCYQANNIDRSSIMGPDTIAEFKSFFEKVKEHNELEVVDLCFIGGETLLAIDTIDSIYSLAKRVFTNIQITTSIVTNGVLLTTPKAISLFNKIQFDCIQVTVDGPQQIHDRCRVFQNGTGSYQVIIDNLSKIQSLGKYNIVINCNLTTNSFLHLDELFSELNTHQIKYPLIFSIVFSGAKNDCSAYEIPQEMQADAWYDAHIRAINAGYSFDYLCRTNRFSCGYYKENQLSIAPDGIIYKCISGIGMDEYKVGHISTYGTRKYYNRLAELIELPNPCTNAQCHSCDYSLICDGGCVFKSMKYGWHCQHNSLLNGNVKLLHYQAIHDINQAR